MKNILITGLPGIGKTTLVKKIVDRLKSLDIECDGFYTEEVRTNKYRVGFDIVTLDGKRAVLARKGSKQLYANMPTVGQYVVHLEDFEKLALPVFETPKKLLIVDEVGKMEMFSKKFQDNVKAVVANPNVRVVATVPLKGTKQLNENKNCQVITVNSGNRDSLVNEIVDLLNE